MDTGFTVECNSVRFCFYWGGRRCTAWHNRLSYGRPFIAVKIIAFIGLFLLLVTNRAQKVESRKKELLRGAEMSCTSEDGGDMKPGARREEKVKGEGTMCLYCFFISVYLCLSVASRYSFSMILRN
jgi:hypothetical protein